MWLLVSKGHSGEHHMHQSAPYVFYLKRKMDQKEESLVKDTCRYKELLSSARLLPAPNVRRVLHFHQITHLEEDDTQAVACPNSSTLSYTRAPTMGPSDSRSCSISLAGWLHLISTRPRDYDNNFILLSSGSVF